MKSLRIVLVAAVVSLLAMPVYAQGAAAKKPADKGAMKKDKKEASYLSQAITHTEVAIKQGKAGKADGVATHAQEALTHATAADKEKSTVHTQAAMKSLQEAVDHGKMGHADIATKAAETALGHLKAK